MQRQGRRSIRIPGFDCSQPGIYFVTVCSHRRMPMFGEVVDREVVLKAIGRIVEAEWLRTEKIRSGVSLDRYIVMPNHLHGILMFSVGATRRVAPTETTLQPGSLGAVMAQYKSMVTKRINILRGMSGVSIWQRNYYDRIIRDDAEMNRIHRYIELNPIAWEDNEENPQNVDL